MAVASPLANADGSEGLEPCVGGSIPPEPTFVPQRLSGFLSVQGRFHEVDEETW